MFFRRKQSGAFSQMPPWMRWGIVLFVLALIIGQNAGRNARENVESGGILPSIADKIDTAPYTQALQSVSQPQLADTEKGGGPVLLCGQTALVRARLFTRAAEETAPEEQEMRIRTGSGESPFFERALIGMRLGGKRKVTLAAPAAIQDILPGSEGDASVAEVEMALEGAEPDAGALLAGDEAMLALRLYDTVIGAGAPAICGEDIHVKLTVWDGAGAVFSGLKEREFTLRIGGGGVPAGIEQAMIGMQKGGTRMVILPPAWQKPLVLPGTNLHMLDVAQGTLLIADITYLGADAPATATPSP